LYQRFDIFNIRISFCKSQLKIGKSRIIYEWEEAVLYSFLLRKGLLSSPNRHTQFFRNLIQAAQSETGQRLIEDYANSDSEVPPDLSIVASTVRDIR
jgi:hypothetical protein